MVNDVFQNNQGVPVIRDGDPELQAEIRNKPHEYGRVFVMVNNEYLGHVGLVIGEGDEALLYDPSGTYSGCDYNTCKSQKKVFVVQGICLNIPILSGMTILAIIWKMDLTLLFSNSL
ncbi:hypothetical protein GKR55_03640 [Providencia stuartii]|nr:hypothetical protein [Providencia stuartii]MTB79639.1 hypothetical protein [Providencia stuartii]